MGDGSAMAVRSFSVDALAAVPILMLTACEPEVSEVDELRALPEAQPGRRDRPRGC